MVLLLVVVILYIAIKYIYFPNCENRGSIMVVRTVKSIPKHVVNSFRHSNPLGPPFFLLCECQEDEMGKQLPHAWKKSMGILRAHPGTHFPFLLLPSVCVNEAVEKNCSRHISSFTPTHKKKGRKRNCHNLKKEKVGISIAPNAGYLETYFNLSIPVKHILCT